MREVSNAESDDIQDRLKEQDAELERLIEKISKQVERLMEKISKQDMEIFGLNLERKDMKSLLTRAADALETYPVGSGWNLLLINELRKAAK